MTYKTSGRRCPRTVAETVAGEVQFRCLGRLWGALFMLFFRSPLAQRQAIRISGSGSSAKQVRGFHRATRESGSLREALDSETSSSLCRVTLNVGEWFKVDTFGLLPM
jgi:hypothetical protein